MFNKYPYTDFHEMNLDWFLSKYKDIFNDIEMLKTIYDKIDNMHASKHYYTIREWLHITNVIEWQAYLDLFNAGFTSLNCYIDTPGTYKLEDGGAGFPVFNTVQMHIYTTVPGVVIDMNGATFYNSHLVINGRNGNVTLVDNNTVDREEYVEGGQAFFTNIDWYCTSRTWYCDVVYDNCKWYDVSPWGQNCIDILGSHATLKNECGFMFDHSDSYSDYNIFGVGHGGSMEVSDRLIITDPTDGNTHYFIKKRQDGRSGRLAFYSSAYNPVTGTSYGPGANKGHFTGFTDLLSSEFIFRTSYPYFQYLTQSATTITDTVINYSDDVSFG